MPFYGPGNLAGDHALCKETGKTEKALTKEPELPPNVIPFPIRLRVVPAPADTAEQHAPKADELGSVIDHNGRVSDLAALIRHLSPAELREMGRIAPRSGQALWDEVVRRWPALAAEIVAGVEPLNLCPRKRQG